MTKVVEILLERGGLLGALLLVAGWTILRLYQDLNRERTAYQLAMSVAQAAAQKREDELLEDLASLHAVHKEDQRRATAAIQEVNDRATEAMQQLNDRVHLTMDKIGELLEHTQSQRLQLHGPQLPPPRAIPHLPPRKTGR